MPTLQVGEDILPITVIEETYAYESDVTENPVERGVDLVDHQRPRPIGITLRVVITNSPLTVPSFASGGTARDDSTNIVRFTERFDLVRDVPLRLRRAQENADTATYLGSQGLLEDLLVARAGVPIASTAGIEIVIDLRQIRLATVLTVPVPIPEQPRAGTRRDRGKQPSKAVTSESEKESLLFKMVN